MMSNCQFLCLKGDRIIYFNFLIFQFLWWFHFNFLDFEGHNYKIFIDTSILIRNRYRFYEVFMIIERGSNKCNIRKFNMIII